MEKKRSSARGHSVGSLFVFLLLCVFALLSLCTVLLSVQSWTGITGDVTELQEVRVAEGYLRTRMRSADRLGALAVTEEGGIPCLRVSEDDYATLIYCYDGSLMEQLLDPESDEPFDPALGETLCSLSALDAAQTAAGLTLRLTFADGNTHEMTTTMRTGGDVS